VDAENLPDNQLLASSMAYDPDDEPLSIRDLPPDFLPKHGTLSLSPDGSFAYTPEDGFIGHDSFSYQLTDHVEQTEYSQAGDFFGSNIITAQINVNPAYVGLAVGDRPDGDNKGILVASMPVLEDADLVPLHLTFPANLPNGTTYTLALNGSAAENIGVWTTNSTAHAADKILGAGAPANKTWTKGANAPAPPTTFYLQGVHQSGWRKPQFTFTVTQPGGKDRNANVRATVREAQSLTIGFYGADDPHFPNDGNKKMMKIFDRIPLDNNHRFKSLQWGDAAKKLHSWADTNGDGHYDPAHGDKARPIRMLGHSWGAKSAINLAWDIHDDDFYRDKTIEVLAVIDPVTHVRGNFNQGVPDNVNYFWNRWQRNKLIPVHALGIDWFFPRGDVIPNVPASSFPSQVEVTAVPPPSTTPIDHWNIIDVVANDAIAIMGGTP
jgi:hypothetical protein